MAKKVAIIGGGLAGSACAYELKKAGSDPVIFEASSELASGASGNVLGLYNPRFYANIQDEAHFYRDAFLSAYNVFCAADDVIEHRANGCLHLVTDEDKQRRYQKVSQQSVWKTGEAIYLSSAQASDVAGIEIPYEAMFLPQSGSVCPHKLCEYYAQGVRLERNARIAEIIQEGHYWRINDEMFDAVVLACGVAVKQFSQAEWLPVHTVRGQVAHVESGHISNNLQTNLCYGGYISAPFNGSHIAGSTFQKWLGHTDVLDQDNAYILNMVHERMSSFDDVQHIIGARASLRCTSSHRLPIIGTVPNASNLYISTAHGSHGLVSTIQAAKMICSTIQHQVEYEYALPFSPSKYYEKMR